MDFIAPLSSTLLRTTAYIFLRVVPAPILQILVVSFYLVHLTSLWFRTNHEPQTVDNKRETPTKTATNSNNILTTLILSLPSPSRILSITNVLFNTALLLASFEFTTAPVYDNAYDVIFTRVGAVNPDSIKVVVRYPQVNVTEESIRLVWRQTPTAKVTPVAWTDGPLVNLTLENDWVATVTLEGLWPETEYEYMLQDNNRTFLSYPAEPVVFHTFPDYRLPTGSHFRFIVTSCMIPNFPYVPRHGRTIKGFDLLAEYLWPSTPQVPLEVVQNESGYESHDSAAHTVEATVTESLTSSSLLVPIQPLSAAESAKLNGSPAPTEFMLFLGDFIYADVPYYYGDGKETYRRLYRRNYQSDSFRKVYERLPIFHIYDDHEIINNFAGLSNDTTYPFPNASSAFRLYNADANYDSLQAGQHYYDFRYGDVAFFVMDTRRYRSGPEVDATQRTMLGEDQWMALYDWLAKVNSTATFKFIVSSVPFTSLWQHDATIDSWAGFHYEKTALLHALHSVPNVIVLSGDRHEFAAIKFTSEDSDHDIFEVSTSPFSMFYMPFVRTLRMKSEDVVHKNKTIVTIAENGTEVITTSIEEVYQEQVLKYLPSGNFKWSTFEVDTRDLEHPTAKLEVIIDGNKQYSLDIVGKPVRLQPSASVGVTVPQTFKGILDKIGLMPSRWF